MKNSFFLILFITQFAFSQSLDPGARDHLGLVYDSNRDCIVLFGGNDVNEDSRYIWNSTTWQWKDFEWKEKNESTPGPISSMGMVYDPSSKSTIMIGGINPDKGDLDETWSWNGSEWTQHTESTPGIRLSPALAYDYKNQEVVLFSGCIGNSYPSDTWIFKENRWIKKSERGPNGVCRAAMFYDHTREKIVLFGGALSRDGKTNEMWEWDGDSWTQIDQGETIPSGRANMLIAYDENRKKAILYGGADSSGVLDDLWEWNGREWTKIPKQDNWPGKKEVYGVVYHSKLKKVLIYGGRSGFAKPEGDFWSWDGEVWEKLN